MNRSTVCAMKLARLAAVGVSLWFAAGCGNSSVNESKTFLANGNKYYGQKQWESAIVEYDKAIERYHDNHLAWYGKGGAYLQKHDYEKASDALQTAVQLAPEQPMYQMFYGVSLYERSAQKAREEQARKENKKPEEITPDLSAVNFEKPLQHLLEAAKLNNEMWRAHYYLGKIYRDQGKAKEAAEELSKAIASNPREWAPYVALGELYRQWDYTDQAIKVTEQGVANVIGANEVTDIWFVLGMGYDDKRLDDKAIDAFGKAIESKKGNYKAKFQRGQAYYRKGDYANAKRDLEDFSKSGGASLEFDKQMASKMLMDIAAKAAGDNKPSGAKESPEDVVKKANGGKGGPAPKGPPPKKK
jgi:tetratricopeptide (TPR) repeat protein